MSVRPNQAGADTFEYVVKAPDNHIRAKHATLENARAWVRLNNAGRAEPVAFRIEEWRTQETDVTNRPYPAVTQ